MGNRLDLEDPRSRAFRSLMAALAEAPPEHLVLESVEGFLGSGAHGLLTRVLEDGGYHRREFRLCPTAFGLPNLRPRVFVAASRRPLLTPPRPEGAPGPVGDFLDPVEDPTLYLDGEALRHWAGLDLVRPEDRRTACFIGGYGRRYLGSGSFLATPEGVRRFSPAEVARLMGLPDTLRFPAGLALETRYKLLGNGLSQPVARWVLRHLDPGSQ
jgi:site-specific DNA-cytosine methylase